MRIAPEGRPFIIAAWLLALALVAFGWWIAAALWLPIAAWVVAFFRDPERAGPRGDHLIIAPADGKVVSIIPIDEPDVVGGAATRISIFMNVFNVERESSSTRRSRRPLSRTNRATLANSLPAGRSFPGRSRDWWHGGSSPITPSGIRPGRANGWG